MIQEGTLLATEDQAHRVVHVWDVHGLMSALRHASEGKRDDLDAQFAGYCFAHLPSSSMMRYFGPAQLVEQMVYEQATLPTVPGVDIVLYVDPRGQPALFFKKFHAEQTFVVSRKRKFV